MEDMPDSMIEIVRQEAEKVLQSQFRMMFRKELQNFISNNCYIAASGDITISRMAYAEWIKSLTK